MSSFRSGVLVTATVVALVWTDVGAQQPASPPKPAPSTTPATPPPPADATATKTLERAIDLVDPSKHGGWVEMKVWQQVDVQGVTFQAEGRYLAAANQRLRLDLAIHLGGTAGQTSVISDGTTVWQTMRIGSSEAAVSKWDRKSVSDQLNAPEMLPQLREEFLPGVAPLLQQRGVVPLLQNLQKQMIFTQQTADRWNGRDVLKLTGVWSPEVIAPRGEGWPLFLPRTCQVYLDSSTLWPYRLEWWGPAPPAPADALLVQMEFREPKLHKAEEPMPPGLVDAFKFDPGSASIIDLTKDLTEQIKMRNQQLAAQKRPAVPAAPGNPK